MKVKPGDMDGLGRMDREGEAQSSHSLTYFTIKAWGGNVAFWLVARVSGFFFSGLDRVGLIAATCLLLLSRRRPNGVGGKTGSRVPVGDTMEFDLTHFFAFNACHTGGACFAM